jgi:hypothetical protein
MSYLKVPLLLQINTSNDPNKNVHLAVGVIGGWNIGTMLKTKYTDQGADHKMVQKSNFNATPFTADLTVRVGYRNFGVFANYSLTPLFKTDRGPSVYSNSIGVSLTFG